MEIKNKRVDSLSSIPTIELLEYIFQAISQKCKFFLLILMNETKLFFKSSFADIGEALYHLKHFKIFAIRKMYI